MKDKIAIGLVNLAAAEASTLIFGKLKIEVQFNERTIAFKTMSEGLTRSASAIAYLPFRVKLKEFE